MRYLHPVAASEKFIAKGVYRFYRNEMRMSKIEMWTRHRLAGGGILTRIDREGESVGLTTLAEVLTTDEGQVERLTVREWNTHPQAKYRSVRANYFVFPNEIHATRTYDDQPTDESVVPLSFQDYLHPPFCVFTSLEIGQDKVAFMPTWNWGGPSLAFRWPEPIRKPDSIDTVSQAPAIVYHFPESTIVFDQRMILQDYHHKLELIQLTEYAHV